MTAPIPPAIPTKPVNQNIGDADRIARAYLWETLVRAGMSKDAATQTVLTAPTPAPQAGTQPEAAGSRVGGLAARTGLQNVSGLLNTLFPSDLVDLSGQPPGGPGSSIGDLAQQPGTGDKLLAGPLSATPQPQSTLEKTLVGAGSQVLPGLALGGPAGVIPAATAGGTAGAIDNSSLPDIAKIILPLLAGGVAAKGQDLVMSGGAKGGAAKVINKVARNEPTTPGSLVQPNEPGMQTLANRVDEPLARALNVPPQDARQVLTENQAKIDAVNAKYPAIMGPPDAPTMVQINPRLRVALENPSIRAAVQAQVEELNGALKAPPTGNPTGQRAPRPPIPDMYDKAGNLVASEVPLEVLDQVKQGLDKGVAKAPTGQSIDRKMLKVMQDKVAEVRNATDEQLANQGHTDYVQVRNERAQLEAQRSAMTEGLNLFKATEKDARGQAVPQTPSSIKAKIAAMTPEELGAFRQGVFTAARERLTNQGLNPAILNRLRLVLEPGQNMQDVVKAIRASQTQQGIVSAAGAKPTGAANSQAALGTVEGLMGMKNASAWHFVRSLFERGVPPEAQAIIQQYLLTPEGATVLKRAMEQQKAVSTGGKIGAAVGTATQTPRE